MATTIDEMWEEVVRKNPNIDNLDHRKGVKGLGNLNLSGISFKGINLSGHDMSGSNLRRSCFYQCDLEAANLQNADLTSVSFIACDLGDASFDGADLYGCAFVGCRFSGATFERVEMNWASHELIGYRLFEAAGDNADKRKIAGLIYLSEDWCWTDFINIPSRHKDWVYRTMKSWLTGKEDEPHHLARLRVYLEQKKDRG